ncbi:hypothetical protein [Sphingomonas sp. 3-13AW]|uniref:hypothetical protein n=1 Tax=Sphingomonas sp. 3-13AW TaxID=3050450 RepID=UPI003BB79BEA
MRALFKKILLLGVSTTAGPLGASLLMPQQANAQIVSPCMLIGSPMPPPCITFDYKRLADIATKRAQEAQKAQAKIQEIKGWTNMQNIMGKLNEAVNQPSLVDKQVFQDLPHSFAGVTASTSFAEAKSGSTKFFAEGDASGDAVTEVTIARETAARGAAVDGIALAWRKGQALDATVADAKRIKSAACKSNDLRTDWAVNSEAKRALAQARATQNYLWQAYLQVYSTSQLTNMPVNQGTAAMPASVATGPTQAPIDNGDLARLQRIATLALEAQSLLDLLGRSRSAEQLQSIVSVAKNDCLDTQNRQANLQAQLPIKAREWACHEGKCSNGPYIESALKAALSSWESQMDALRSRDIASLGVEFQKRNLDVQQLLASETDPRQFIGTWGDPIKYDMLNSIAKNLVNGKRDQYNNGRSIDSYIKGDADEAEFAQMLYDWEDVRQEVAWKFSPRIDGEEGSGGICTEAAFSEQAADAYKSEAQSETSTTLTQDEVTKKLREIAAEGDQLGAALTQSSDPITIEAARGQLARLQAVLNQGVQLPDHAGFDPAQCQAAADYVATQTDGAGRPLSMGAEEMEACLRGSSNPSSPYYVAR